MPQYWEQNTLSRFILAALGRLSGASRPSIKDFRLLQRGLNKNYIFYKLFYILNNHANKFLLKDIKNLLP